MKKIILSALTLLLLEGITYASEVEYSGIVEVLPGNVILGSDIDNFRVDWNKGTVKYDEEINAKSIYAPSIGVGLDISSRYMKYQFVGGYSYIKNGEFSANSLKFDIAALYSPSEYNRFSIGGHVTTHSFFSPKWSGNADVKFSDTSAIAPGIVALFGDEFIIKASLDYLSGSSFDVRTPVGTTTSQSSLSLDGYMFQFGVMYNFK